MVFLPTMASCYGRTSSLKVSLIDLTLLSHGGWLEGYYKYSF
jgi:hypothetical protein